MNANQTDCTTPKFRASYPALFVAKLNKLNGKMEYSVEGLFPADTNFAGLQAAMMAAATKKFGPDQTKWPKLRNPIRDQVEKTKTIDGKQVLPAPYKAGDKFIHFKNTQKPGVVDENVQDIIDPNAFYAGCWAKAAVNASAYAKGANAGVSFYLSHIQKVGEGEPLGGTRPAAEEYFSPIAPVANGSEIGNAAPSTAAGLFS